MPKKYKRLSDEDDIELTEDRKSKNKKKRSSRSTSFFRGIAILSFSIGVVALTIALLSYLSKEGDSLWTQLENVENNDDNVHISYIESDIDKIITPSSETIRIISLKKENETSGIYFRTDLENDSGFICTTEESDNSTYFEFFLKENVTLLTMKTNDENEVLIGIGTNQPEYTLHINGTLKVNNETTFSGDIDLGSNSMLIDGGTIFLNGTDITELLNRNISTHDNNTDFSNINSDVNPMENATYTLGNEAKQWLSSHIIESTTSNLTVNENLVISEGATIQGPIFFDRVLFVQDSISASATIHLGIVGTDGGGSNGWNSIHICQYYGKIKKATLLLMRTTTGTDWSSGTAIFSIRYTISSIANPNDNPVDPVLYETEALTPADFDGALTDGFLGKIIDVDIDVIPGRAIRTTLTTSSFNGTPYQVRIELGMVLNST